MSISTYKTWGNGMSEQAVEQQALKHATVVVPGIPNIRGTVITGGDKVRAVISVPTEHGKPDEILDERQFEETQDAVNWCASWIRGSVT